MARFCEELEDSLKVRAPAAVAVAAALCQSHSTSQCLRKSSYDADSADGTAGRAKSNSAGRHYGAKDRSGRQSGVVWNRGDRACCSKTSKPELMVSRLQSGRNRWLGVVVAIAVAGTSGILLWRMRSPGAGSSGSVAVTTTDLGNTS